MATEHLLANPSLSKNTENWAKEKQEIRPSVLQRRLEIEESWKWTGAMEMLWGFPTHPFSFLWYLRLTVLIKPTSWHRVFRNSFCYLWYSDVDMDLSFILSTWKVFTTLKLRAMFYLVGIFRTSGPGNSISSNPERAAPRGEAPGYIEVLQQRAGSLNIKRLLLK